MSPRPFRLRVLDALTATLQKITPANDYQNDMSEAVFRGRLIYGDDEPLPMISILEPPVPLDVLVSESDTRLSSGQWELMIQGFVTDDHLHPTDPAHILMAEVKRALVEEKHRERGRNILGMGGRVVEMQIGQGTVRPADQVSARAFFWLILTLRLVEKLDKPYE